MCGLFGFIGTKPERKLLMQIAVEASRRGPHAFGFAWQNGYIKRAGNLAENLSLLEQVSGNWLIGHARLATSGDWKRVENNQPLNYEPFWLAHNGNIYDADRIFRQYNYTPLTDNDSEAILAIASRQKQNYPLDIGNCILKEIGRRSPMAMLLIMQHKNILLAIQDGHPLFVYEQPEGTYFCSRPVREEARLLPSGSTIFQIPETGAQT